MSTSTVVKGKKFIIERVLDQGKLDGIDLSEVEVRMLCFAETNAAAKDREQKMKKQNKSKRNLFAELMEGVDAMKAHREGKVTLQTHKVAAPEYLERVRGKKLEDNPRMLLK